MNIYSWSNTPAAAQLVWADCRRPAADAAGDAIAALAPLPAANRVLFFWQPFGGMLDSDIVDLLNKGIPWQASGEWFRAFYQALHLAGIAPARIVLDYEETLSVWRWFNALPCDGADGSKPRVDLMTRIYAGAAKKLPNYVTAHQPTEYYCHMAGHAAYLDWGRFAGGLLTAACRHAAADTAICSFGKTLPISNYGDARVAYAVADSNGWETRPQDSRGLSNWSSPALYLDGSWAGFVRCLNWARACLSKGTQFAPWVSYPLFGSTAPDASKQWAWRQLIFHLRANGTETLLLWNPNGAGESTAAQEAFAKGVFDEIATLKTKRLKLPAIPADADGVTTGAVITTRAEFEGAHSA